MKQAYTYKQVNGKSQYKFKQVVRNHSKWLLPGSRDLNEERNEEERRPRMVVWKGWLWDVLDGRLGAKEEGEWGI